MRAQLAPALLRAGSTCALALVLAACPKVPPQTAAMQAVKNVDVSAEQLQLRNYETARRATGLIVLAADTIAARSTDPSVQLRAIQWKVSAIPLIQEAALRDDPLVSAVDLAALSVQQVDYFTAGDGRSAFGTQQPVAVRASQAMRDQIYAELARSTRTGTVRPEAMDTLAAWAARNPIRGQDMQRPSILGSDWSAVGLVNTTLGATAGNIDRTMRLVTLRLSYMNETLGEMMRWNAELAAVHALATPRGDSMLVQTAGAVRSVGVLANDFQGILSEEVASLMTGVDRQRILAMKDVDRERVAAMADLAVQRVALEAMVARERAAVMTSVSAERVAIMRSADSVAQRTVERSERAASRLVLEVLLAVLVAIAAAVAGGLFLMRRWRSTAPARSSSAA